MIQLVLIVLLQILTADVDSKYGNFFTYTDLASRTASTEQFDGCIVFISFWSRSCGPCIRGFAKHKDLRQNLIDDGVIIINATIDNMDDWINACNRYNPNGLNIRPINKELQGVQRHFDVYSLPVYATIDIDGSLVQYPKALRGDILDFNKWYQDNY